MSLRSVNRAPLHFTNTCCIWNVRALVNRAPLHFTNTCCIWNVQALVNRAPLHFTNTCCIWNVQAFVNRAPLHFTNTCCIWNVQALVNRAPFHKHLLYMECPSIGAPSSISQTLVVYVMSGHWCADLHSISQTLGLHISAPIELKWIFYFYD